VDALSFSDGFNTHHSGTLRCRPEGHRRHQQSHVEYPFLNEDFGASTTPWYAAQQGRHQISAITLDTDLLLQELY
jgi:hypothetical protein